ncbi:MAG: class I SAM-dependent methyltransferase, partial [Bacteroidales bacterium]
QVIGVVVLVEACPRNVILAATRGIAARTERAGLQACRVVGRSIERGYDSHHGGEVALDNLEQEEIIRKYLVEAGLEKKVILHIGEAIKIIPTLDETWDLVYIDADKPNYLNYYKLVLDRVRPGGFILADNALWDGKVLEPNTRSRDTHGIIDFNDFVSKDDKVENLLLPFRDGLMIVRKND